MSAPYQELSIAEVFLSLDALTEGEQFFREALPAAGSKRERLSKALVLTRFLLARKKYAEYADLATDLVLPLLLKTWKPFAPETGSPGQSTRCWPCSRAGKNNGRWPRTRSDGLL